MTLHLIKSNAFTDCSLPQTTVGVDSFTTARSYPIDELHVQYSKTWLRVHNVTKSKLQLLNMVLLQNIQC